jgi:hypothetical protein
MVDAGSGVMMKCQGGTPAQGGAIRSPPLLGCGARRGDLRIAHAHEMTMKSGYPPLIGFSWASAERSPPLLGCGAVRWTKEGRSPNRPCP